MTIKKKFLLAPLLMFVAMFVPSCGGDDNDISTELIIGTWQLTSRVWDGDENDGECDSDEFWLFTSDRRITVEDGNEITDSGHYDFDGSRLIIHLYEDGCQEWENVYDGKASINGNIMTYRFTDEYNDSGVMTFRKVIR
jgi:hypothetical protein